MWSLHLGALLVCACAEVLVAYIPGFGLHHSVGFNSVNQLSSGNPFQGDSSRSSTGEPLLLNCFSSFKDAAGNLDNEIAVTIQSSEDDTSDAFLAGFGGVGYPYSGFGGFSPVYPGGLGGGFGRRPGSGNKLSARIQLFSTSSSGRAYVVFTERARVDRGCSAANFGDVLTRRSIQSESGLTPHHAAGLGYGYGTAGLGYPGGYGGYAGGYGGYAGGYGGYAGGYGGYAGGYGSLYGVGLGVGAGFGMGHDLGLLNGADGAEGEGVVTELTITPGALTTAVVDDVGFDRLSDLAGRGLVVCSDISYDWNWTPVCAEPYYSCCALKYDSVGVSLVD